MLRDWSKSIRWGGGGGGCAGAERGGSSVFELLVRGGSFNFQLPIEVGHPQSTTKVTLFKQ